MTQNNKWFVMIGMLAGFLGGLFTNALFSYAQSSQNSNTTVASERFELVDNNGRVSGLWTSCGAGSPCINFMDENGILRLQLGLYNSPGEAGLPFITLNNERGEVKALVRLFGGQAAPVVILKNKGQDRLVMGLDLQTSEQPFLATINGAGQKKMIFGNF